MGFAAGGGTDTIARVISRKLVDAWPQPLVFIYPRWTPARNEFEGHSPRVNASKPPGEWQAFDVVFRAPRFDADGKKTENAKFVKVAHNGQVVHENVEVTGPTRAAAFDDEKPAGPLLLQGDHGPVAYRNIRIKKVELK